MHHCFFPITFALENLNPSQSHINAFVSGLAAMGLTHAVISPGSRNAPLIMAFARNKGIQCQSAIDERSAAFIALGMAKESGKPVAVICTSGSAVLNFYPAIVEAWYMQVPLLLISADRPSDLIDRWDGQAIHQFEVFASHIKASLQTPEYSGLVDEFFQLAEGAYAETLSGIKGPVHINIPLSEPLYAEAESVFEYPVFPLQEYKNVGQRSDLPLMDAEWLAKYPKILVLNGAADWNKSDADAMLALSSLKHAVVLSDIISGKHQANSFQNWEAVFLNANEEQKSAFKPDLLITTGKMILNKNLRQFLKTHKPTLHWHIEENGYCADTFETNPIVYRTSIEESMNTFCKALADLGVSSYYESWNLLSESQFNKSKGIVDKEFNEQYAVECVLSAISDEQMSLHLANSMSIRLAAYAMPLIKANWHINANRGVSGIDGCTSTAIGMALQSRLPNLFITGDLAFLYDSNAFMTDILPQNLKIVVLNNRGGGIFKQIDGPSKMGEELKYVYTGHPWTAEHIASQFNIQYFCADSFESFKTALQQFQTYDGLSVFEVFTDSSVNSNIFKQYKQLHI